VIGFDGAGLEIETSENKHKPLRPGKDDQWQGDSGIII